MRLLVAFAVLSCVTLCAAPPTIPNREPQIDEIGYRPADHSITEINPPSFTWLHEKAAKTYAVQWSLTPDFNDAVSATNLHFNCYTHNRALNPGKYFWRYRYETADGKSSDWSLVRDFTVEKSAIEFPMPSREERHQLVPKNHPRLFVRPEDLPRLREAAKGTEAKYFSELRKSADKLALSEPPAEPEKMGSARNKRDLEAIANWWPNRQRSDVACAEAEIVAFVYLITGEKKYGEAARKRILLLATWNPDGPTNFKLNCEAAKPLLHRLPRAYDWAYDLFSADEHALIRKVMQRRLRDAWESHEVGRGVGHLNRPLGSHANRTWHKIGESGIVFLGEIPEAEMWLDYALNKFYACYPVWSDDDGGWHEGGAYYAGYMSKAVWWLEAARVALRIDGFQKPFFAQIGDFALYQAAPNAPNVGNFGDLSYRNTSSSWSFMEYYIRMAGRNPESNAAYWSWWWDAGKLQPASGIFGFLYRANLPEMPAAKTPVDLPTSKIFRGTGIASLHSTLLNSSNDVHFIFKASPFGSQSHGHNPQNTFQLNAYGESLLETCVYRDLHGSDFHYKWAHETKAHNGVLVNGKGQMPHSAKSRGEIVDFALGSKWDYVAGDATESYGGRLQRCDRRVIFVKPDANELGDADDAAMILIYDDLVAPEPSQFQFMLHAPVSFDASKTDSQWSVQKTNAGVTVKYFSPQPLKFTQTNGWPFEAIRGSLPDQWHLEASTTTASSQLGMLTLLVPHRGKEAPHIQAERLETSTAIGARVQVNGKIVLLAFRKANVDREAELAGSRFNSASFLK